MRFSFTLAKQDLTAFHKLANRRLTKVSKANSKLLLANFIAWIPLGIALAAYTAMYRKYPELSHDLNVVAGAIVVGGVLLVASMMYKQYLYRGAVVSQGGWFFKPQTMEADSDGLRIENETSRSLYRWDAFVHGAEDATNLYLFLDNAHAIIIPKSALGSPEHIVQLKSWSRIGEP